MTITIAAEVDQMIAEVYDGEIKESVKAESESLLGFARGTITAVKKGH